MDTLESNYTLSVLLLSNGTENVTQGLGKSEAEKKMSVAKTIFVLLSVLGIIGNTISILALSKSKKVRNATTAFIVNLCVADLAYCLLTLANFLEPRWNKNYYYCRWFPMARYWVAGESVYTLVAITINRYVCVVHPKIYRSMYKPRYVGLMILVTWLYALMLALLPFFEFWGTYGYDRKMGVCSVLKLNGTSPINYFFISAFAIPSVAFAICYPRIFWIVHKTSKRVRTFTASSAVRPTLNTQVESTEEKFIGSHSGNYEMPSSCSSENQYQKEIRILKVMLVIVVGFIICYFPIAFIKILEKEKDLPVFLIISLMGISLSNVINPIIYVVMSSEYRVAYKELFHCQMVNLFINSVSTEMTSS